MGFENFNVSPQESEEQKEDVNAPAEERAPENNQENEMTPEELIADMERFKDARDKEAARP